MAVLSNPSNWTHNIYLKSNKLSIVHSKCELTGDVSGGSIYLNYYTLPPNFPISGKKLVTLLNMSFYTNDVTSSPNHLYIEYRNFIPITIRKFSLPLDYTLNQNYLSSSLSEFVGKSIYLGRSCSDSINYSCIIAMFSPNTNGKDYTLEYELIIEDA